MRTSSDWTFLASLQIFDHILYRHHHRSSLSNSHQQHNHQNHYHNNTIPICLHKIVLEHHGGFISFYCVLIIKQRILLEMGRSTYIHCLYLIHDLKFLGKIQKYCNMEHRQDSHSHMCNFLFLLVLCTRHLHLYTDLQQREYKDWKWLFWSWGPPYHLLPILSNACCSELRTKQK